MAATGALVILVLLVDLSWGLMATVMSRCLCPSTAREILLLCIVLWLPLFVMVAMVWPRGGAGAVSAEHCPSARSVALSVATWLGNGMPFDGDCDFLALQGVSDRRAAGDFFSSSSRQQISFQLIHQS